MAAADPKRRSTNASIAALSRWSKQDSKQGIAPARRGFEARFEREVDPEGVLPVDERLRRANCAMRAHMARLGQRSGAARREMAVTR